MRTSGRLALTLGLLAVFIGLLALPALAQEEGDEGDETATTAVSEDLSPAVPVAPEPPQEAELDWTYRYLIPTTLVVAVVIIVLTSIGYFTEVVRKRYRIIQE